MKKLIEKINLLFLSILVPAFVLRFFNLGYSDYQGDEIKALYIPGENEGFFNYLMDQRKGPVQFIITWLIKFVDPDYSNQLLARFLFALAGFLAVYFMYRLVSIHFSRKTALFSALLLASNGFFVAFSRIVQYQSFVILFMILSLYMFSLALKKTSYRHKGIILGFVFWALGILSHYDAVFIFPFAAYLLSVWYKRYFRKEEGSLKTVGVSLVLSAALLLVFYIPFVLSISDSTLSYWSGRISGEVSSKISSSKYLFTVYQPIYVVHFYVMSFFLGLAVLYYRSFGLALPKKNILKRAASYLSLFLWFLVPFAFMEGLVYIPGTHIYVYLIPVMIIMSIGLDGLYEFLVEKTTPLLVWAYQVVMFLIFTFIFAQSYFIYVDNFKEYPWQQEKFFVWTFHEPTPIYHLSLFGFPYYRDWEGIGNFVKQYPEITAYSTNERKSIVRHYIPLDKDTDRAGFYIHIRNPQTFNEEASSKKSEYWMQNYDPIFSLSRFGEDYVRMYIMEPGTLDEIILKGY